MSNLLERIAMAIEAGTSEERKALLVEAAERIKRLNAEYDTMCEERGRACDEVQKLKGGG